MLIEEVLVIQHSAFNIHHSLRALPRPGEPAAHVRICLALLPSGPDAVRRLRLHRDRAAVRPAAASILKCTRGPPHRQARRIMLLDCAGVTYYFADEEGAHT